jgi:hypothetical protein
MRENVLAVLFCVASAACSGGGGGNCNASLCPDGCCDQAGICQQPSADTCGSNGMSCVSCGAEMACSAGRCVPSGSGGGSGGGGTGGGNTGPMCSGVALTSDGVLDLDVKLVQITGNVTLNGQPLPSMSSGRGSIVFKNTLTKTSLSVDLDANGAYSYAVTLTPGSYDVSFSPDFSACGGTAATSMPCSGGALKQNVSLTQDGVLDVDIPAVHVSGHVTLKGGALPTQSMDRGTLVFAMTDATGAQRTLGSSGDVNYQVTLLPGSYTVSYSANASACTGTTLSALPCTGGALHSANLSQDGTLDVDIPAITVSGAVTLNGAAMPTQPGDRGALNFALKDMSNASSRSFGTSGAASYQMRLLPGHYVVQYSAPFNACDGTTAPPMPCNAGAVKELDLMQDGTLDIDVPRVQVTGALTLNGAPPASGQGSGGLSFQLEHGGSAQTKFLGSPSAAYTLSLIPGHYMAQLIPSACPDFSTAPEFPCNGGVVADAMLTSDGNLDVDVKTVKVSGAVTLSGAPLPNTSASRGGLTFEGKNGAGSLSPQPFPQSGSVTYGFTLLQGTYDVHYSANPGQCAQLQAPALPCIGTKLKTGLQLINDGTLDLDITTVHVNGTVTVNGQPFPNMSFPAEVFFSAVGGDTVNIPLEEIGSGGQYAATLVPAHYVVENAASAQLCDGMTAASVPCVSGVLMGCP